MRRITEVETLCTVCGWMGAVGDTEPGEDGDLCCPKCRALVLPLMTAAERGVTS